MGFDHVFHRVGDQFPAGQGIAHALVPLADAIANGNGGEFPRYAAGLPYALRHALGQLPQVEVPGHHFRKRVYDGNERLGQGPLLQAGAVQQGTVGGTLNAVGQHSAATIFVMHGILHIVLVGHMEHSFLLMGWCFFHRNGNAARRNRPESNKICPVRATPERFICCHCKAERRKTQSKSFLMKFKRFFEFEKKRAGVSQEKRKDRILTKNTF